METETVGATPLDEFENFTHPNKLIIKNGGQVSKSVTKKVNYLVCGEKANVLASKLDF